MQTKVLQVEQMEAHQILNGFAEIKDELLAIKKHISETRPLELIPREQVAKLFDISYSTLHEWVKKGVITAHKAGHRVYFHRSEIESALVTIQPRRK